MQNPILQVLKSPSPNNLAQIKQLANMVKTAKNPQAMIGQMLQNNPHYKEAVDFVNQNGGDPKQALNLLAQQNGLDINEILNMFR